MPPNAPLSFSAGNVAALYIRARSVTSIESALNRSWTV